MYTIHFIHSCPNESYCTKSVNKQDKLHIFLMSNVSSIGGNIRYVEQQVLNMWTETQVLMDLLSLTPRSSCLFTSLNLEARLKERDNVGPFCLHRAHQSPEVTAPFQEHEGRYGPPLICHLPLGNKRTESRVNGMPVLQQTDLRTTVCVCVCTFKYIKSLL